MKDNLGDNNKNSELSPGERFLLDGNFPMDKTAEIGLLFSFYRNMLTKRQCDCIDLYYNEDLSLAEISDILGITRQGVRDNVKRAEHVMYETERKLGLAGRFLHISDNLDKIDDIIRKIEKSPNIRFLSDDIKHMINDIIVIINSINNDEKRL